MNQQCRPSPSAAASGGNALIFASSLGRALSAIRTETSGCAKAAATSNNPINLESFLEAIFQVLPGVLAHCPRGDGRYGNRHATT